MDTRKVLQKINLILSIETSHNLQGMFQNILSYYQSNDPDNLENEKKSLKSAIEESEINNLIQSDFSILEGLGIRGYFDTESIENLEKMLNAPGYTIQNKITEFINKRAELIQHISQLKSSVESLGIKEDETQNIYQIVLIVPKTYRGLGEMETFLKDMKLFLEHLNSKDKSSVPPQIVSVSNGSIELFIEASEPLADYFSITIDYILEVAATIGAFEFLKKQYQEFSKTRKTKMENMAREELEEKKKEIMDNLIKKLPFSNEEDKNKAEKFVFKLVNHIEKGVHIEVKTPQIEISENDTEEIKRKKRNAIKTLKQKELIDKRNKKLFLTQKEGINLELPKPKNDES